ncbi:MAG: DUF2071 domain-containing protein [Chloroflexi bacterium]|nr:DUF2071 domain-containing protein [Chloroflexota bacterium]
MCTSALFAQCAQTFGFSRVKCAHLCYSRWQSNAPTATLTANYGPNGNVFEAQVGSLKYFLTARYYFYTADTHEKLYRGEIEHTAWPLQPAKATI